ncbi:MAG: pilus assembly protein TadG-related protein [Terriglobales bacterium]
MTNLFATPKQSLKRFLRADEGQALVLTALALVVLLLMAGLGVDVGYLRYQKQQMQKAADAGALAGAAALGYDGAWKAAAVADVNANGFTTTKSDGTATGVQITVDKPWEGPFAGQDGYVEVSVSQPQPTFFMKAGGFTNPIPVRSWAVASAVAPGSGCMYAMDPNSDPATFLVNGSVTIGSTCAIYVNSSNSSALTKLGASGTIKASYIGIVGECSASGGSGCAPPAVVSDLSSGQLPVTHIAPVNDPLANVCPTTASCPELIPSLICSPTNGVTTFSPGTYCGLSLGSNHTYKFKPGVYILLGGLSVTGSPTITSTGGVTFYNTYTTSHPYGGITMAGSPTVTLSAPTTGHLAGMLFFQDRSVPVGSSVSNFKGSSAQGYTGAIYFPTTDITFDGTPSLSSTATIMLGYKLHFSGNTSIENYTYLPTGGGPIHGATLAE